MYISCVAVVADPHTTTQSQQPIQTSALQHLRDEFPPWIRKLCHVSQFTIISKLMFKPHTEDKLLSSLLVAMAHAR